MATPRLVAVVTGANQGIGLELARQIAGAEGVKVVMACRREAAAREAERELKAQGLNVEYMPLDINSQDSIAKFAAACPQCDILVNNAAMAFKAADPTPFAGQARPTVECNYFGTLAVTQAMLPALRQSAAARVVTVASMAGHLRILKSAEKKALFKTSETTLTLDALNAMMRDFVTDVEANGPGNAWAGTTYGMSKCGVIALTRVLQRTEPGIKWSCFCPGYCKTSMSSNKGPRPAAEGASIGTRLAVEEPCPEPLGLFWENNKVSEW